MIFAVSSAAVALRSMQNTCAPSRANVTAVALPLPQPGPIEPAPTTIATLPLSRCIMASFGSFIFSPILFGDGNHEGCGDVAQRSANGTLERFQARACRPLTGTSCPG